MWLRTRGGEFLGNKMAKARSVSLRILLNLPGHGYWVLDLLKEETHDRVVGRIRANYMAINENMPPVLDLWEVMVVQPQGLLRDSLI